MTETLSILMLNDVAKIFDGTGRQSTPRLRDGKTNGIKNLVID